MRNDENYLVFDGRKTNEWGVWVSGSGTYKHAVRNITSAQIAGANGAKILDNGYYENVQIPYDAFISRHANEGTLDDFGDFLASHADRYYRLEDAYHPEEFRLARFTGEFAPTMGKLNRSSKFTITFDCKPQRYLKSGEKEIAITAEQTVFNPTREKARPIITATGAGTFQVGEFKFTKTTTDKITIDCETGAITGGSEDVFYWDNLFDLPFLSVGQNKVIPNTVKLSIIPRWFTK